MNDSRIIDLAPTAGLIIRDLIGLKSNEELLIIVDTETIMPMAYSLAFVASEIGSEYSISLMPSREKGYGRKPELVNILPKAVEKAYTAADAIIGMTRGSFAPTTADIATSLVYMTSKDKTKKSVRYMSMAFRDLESMTRGGCLADYKSLKVDCLKVKNLMDITEKIRVTSSLGTDFTAEMPKPEHTPLFKGPFVRIENGWANTPGSECGFPDGEVFFVPKQYSANGVLMVDGPIEMVEGSADEKPVKVIIEKNKIVKVEGEGHRERRLREIFAKLEDSDVIAEVAIGLNPVSLKNNGNVQEEKKALGNVHIGFGVGTCFPGFWTEHCANKIHSDMVIRNAVVYVDEKKIIENNKLLI